MFKPVMRRPIVLQEAQSLREPPADILVFSYGKSKQWALLDLVLRLLKTIKLRKHV